MDTQTWASLRENVPQYQTPETAAVWAASLSGPRGRVYAIDGRYVPASAGSRLEQALLEAGGVLHTESVPA